VSKRDHNHLLGMLASFETRCGKYDTLNVILPFAGGGNLYNFLRIERESRWEQSGYPISAPLLVGCLADWRYAVYREVVGLADALAELHSDKNGKYMMHCDIKPDNILIHNRTFKIADFGLTRFKDSNETSKTTWYLGTALYSPPEREDLMGRGRDVWALGCVFLEIAFMIRYAFQDDPVFFNPDVTNAIDHFKFLREKSCEDKGREKTAIYHKTMECVHFYMTTFNEMRLGLRRAITLDGMMPIIKRMLDVDQARRITASDAARSLESHYLEIQRDPQFQRDIICRENPGGRADEWPKVENDLSRPHFNQSTTQGDGPFHAPPKPPLSQERYPIASDTTGATARLDDMGLNGQKRSSSAEEMGSNKRPYNGSYNMHRRQ
jgi:serine/threonine protein kinase